VAHLAGEDSFTQALDANMTKYLNIFKMRLCLDSNLD
jgi:hypothetical protein